MSLQILLNVGVGVGVVCLAVNNSAFILMERTPFGERSKAVASDSAVHMEQFILPFK